MARHQEDVLELLQHVENWADQATTIDPGARPELLASLHAIPIEAYCQTTPQPPAPRPLRHPEDEGPQELLNHILRLLRSGVQPRPERAIRRACRAITRKVDQLTDAQTQPRRREPELRAGAIIGAHRPTADQPTARERLRATEDHDPWDD